MTISATTNFNFPLLDDAAENAGAVINGVLTDIDKLLAEARDPACTRSGEILFDRVSGNIILNRKG